MATHIKILGWLHIIFGIFGLLTALAIFGGTMFGAMFAGSFTNSAIVGIGGTFAALFFLAMAIPGLAAGYGLLTRQPWGRILGIILGVISLIRFPFGTLLGVYTLWVLLSKEGAAQFGVVG